MIVVFGLGGGYWVIMGFSVVCWVLDEMDLLNCVIYLIGLFGFVW